MNLHDLTDALLGLAVIAAAVILVVLFGREPKAANEHTVDDYRPEPVDAATRDVDDALTLVGPPRRRLRAAAALDVLPPALAGPTSRASLYSKLYAEQVVAEQMRERYGTTSPDVIAARMLREIGADGQDKAGIGPAHDHWVHWDGSCEMDCPGCARDMVGAFPVVRAAA